MFQSIWIIAALVKVTFHTLFQLGKKLLSTEYDPLHIALVSTTIGIALYVPVVIITQSWGQIFNALLDPTLILLMSLSGLLNVGIYYTSLRAMQTEDVSVVTPITQTYPIIVAILEPILIGEIRFSPFLLAAALLAGMGGYGVMLEDRKDALKPIRKLSNPGVQFALAVTLFSAFTAIVDRTALLRSGLDPYLYVFPAGLFLITSIAVLVVGTGRGMPEKKMVYDTTVIGTGCAIAGMSLFTYVTFSFVTATEATIAFLLVAPATVIVGGSILEEEGVVRKTVAALLVIVGVAIAVIV